MLIYTNQFVWSFDTLAYYFKKGTIYYIEICVTFNIQRDINCRPEALFSHHFH